MKVEADPNRLAPVAVFTHTRADHLIATLEALKANRLAPHTTIHVVSDGPRGPDDEASIRRIRDYVDDLKGFREVVRVYRPRNLGLRVSPPQAEAAILADHGRIIVMEDDNLTSPDYLDFLNAGLQHFEDDPAVFSICGYCPPVGPQAAGDDSDFWYYPWNLSWGYALWKYKMDRLRPLETRYEARRGSGELRRQNRAGGLYVTDSLRRHHKGQKYFPDAILGTAMFAAGMRCVLPVRSKVRNTGQDGTGQSTSRVTDKYDVPLDSKPQVRFDLTQESSRADAYREAAIRLYNGSSVTRVARLLGAYHALSAARTRWIQRTSAR